MTTKSYFVALIAVLLGIASFMMARSIQSERPSDSVNSEEGALIGIVPRHAASAVVSNIENPRENQSKRTQQEQHESNVEIFGLDVEADFNSIFDGEIRIGEFIRHLETLAQNGNADSMHFLAEAMKDCIASMSMVQPVIDKVAQESGTIAANLADYRDLVKQEGLRDSEFLIEEWSKRIDRAYECFSLNRDIQTLSGEHERWESLARERGQPHAVAAHVTAGLQNKSPEDLQHAKNVIKGILASNKSLEIFLAAADMSAFVTHRQGPQERLAWALLACEYYDCKARLSYRYRTTCEIDAVYGDTYCSVGMTDYEYLRAKLPEYFDLARGRAMELKQAIDQEQWEQLGL